VLPDRVVYENASTIGTPDASRPSGSQANEQIVVQSLSAFLASRRDLHLDVIHERLQKNQVNISLEQRLDLFVKTLGPIDFALFRFEGR